MRKICMILSFLLVFGCTNKKDINYIIIQKWKQCNYNNCTIDFANEMWFDWDIMCYYSGANSLEDINKDLGFELKHFIDIGDRIIFLKNNKIVYHKEWNIGYNNSKEDIIFVLHYKKLKIPKRHSKFIIKKQNDIFYLEKLNEK